MHRGGTRKTHGARSTRVSQTRRTSTTASKQFQVLSQTKSAMVTSFSPAVVHDSGLGCRRRTFSQVSRHKGDATQKRRTFKHVGSSNPSEPTITVDLGRQGSPPHTEIPTKKATLESATSLGPIEQAITSPQHSKAHPKVKMSPKNRVTPPAAPPRAIQDTNTDPSSKTESVPPLDRARDALKSFITPMFQRKSTEPIVYSPITLAENQQPQKKLDTNMSGQLIYGLDTKQYDKLTHSLFPPLSIVVMSLGALSSYHWDLPATALWVAAAFASSFNIYARSHIITRMSVDTHPQLDKLGTYPKSVDTKRIKQVHLELFGFPLSPRIVKSVPLSSCQRIPDESFLKQYVKEDDIENATYSPMFQTIKLSVDNKQYQVYVDQVRNPSYFNQVLSYTKYSPQDDNHNTM